MSVNDEGRQNDIADELAEVARALVLATRTVPHPSDSYELLASLRSAQLSLAQVYAQLGAWHEEVVGGKHYNGEDSLVTGQPATGSLEQATEWLEKATASAAQAHFQLGGAHASNGVVRWFDQVKETA